MATPEAERFRIAVELQQTGIAMHRQTLRRRHPEVSDEQLEALLREWLDDRPLDYSPT